MSFEYKLLTDSSVDMTAEFAAENEIGMIPLSYSIGEENFDCDHVETPEERRRFYTAQRQGLVTHTAQTNLQTCTEILESYAREGVPVLCLTLSGGLSGSYNTTCLAAESVLEDYPDAQIRIVDSRSATAGIGMLLELAAANRAAGMSLSENADWLEANRLRVQHWFMVDDLMFLRRGGRLSAASAVIGTALSIKPLLKIEADGTLVNFAKKRSARQAEMAILQHYEELGVHEPGEIVYIVHSDNEAAAAFLAEGARKINPECRLRTVELSPVIGSHTGPGMCALVHLSAEKDARR